MLSKHRIKLDPDKVEYNNHGFRVVIKDPVAFREKIRKMRQEVIKDLTRKKE